VNVCWTACRVGGWWGVLYEYAQCLGLLAAAVCAWIGDVKGGSLQDGGNQRRLAAELVVGGFKECKGRVVKHN
jgi:hypothetical protein